MKTLLLFLVFSLSSLQAKVYDCFLFFNELEILNIRLHELDEVVDYFVLVESHETFQGNPKPLYFEENKEMFAPFLDRIIHIVVERHPEFQGCWEREFFQRDSIARGITRAQPHDIVMLSDLDEIPRATKVEEMKNALWSSKTLFYFYMRHYQFHLNRNNEAPWLGTLATTALNMRRSGAQHLRIKRRLQTKRGRATHIQDGGWHFESIGSCENFIYKKGSYSHPATSEEATVVFDERIKNSSCIPINNTFPRFVVENQDYFESIGYILPVIEK